MNLYSSRTPSWPEAAFTCQTSDVVITIACIKTKCNRISEGRHWCVRHWRWMQLAWPETQQRLRQLA